MKKKMREKKILGEMNGFTKSKKKERKEKYKEFVKKLIFRLNAFIICWKSFKLYWSITTINFLKIVCSENIHSLNMNAKMASLGQLVSYSFAHYLSDDNTNI